jgi:hypothetical protein
MLALVILPALAANCTTSERDSPGGGGRDSGGDGGGAGSDEGGAGENGLGGSGGASPDAGAGAAPEEWLSTCQACAAQTAACSDEDCLRCIFEEPVLDNSYCDPQQTSFQIESLAILNAECSEACSSAR